jgi:hypothetical protein
MRQSRRNWSSVTAGYLPNRKSPTTALTGAWIRFAVKRLRDQWRDFQAEDSLHAMASGEHRLAWREVGPG